jgi:hypothetical protein
METALKTYMNVHSRRQVTALRWQKAVTSFLRDHRPEAEHRHCSVIDTFVQVVVTSLHTFVTVTGVADGVWPGFCDLARV